MMKKFASRLGLRSIVGQQSVEKNNLGRHLGDAARFFVVRILCRRDEQSKDQSRHRRYEAHRELHGILRLTTKMVCRKQLAEQQTQQRCAKETRENQESSRDGAQERHLRK